jgi:hypothetical protein
VWFYTHWGATELVETVQEALRRGKLRWDDEEYLARIIFNQMTGPDWKSTTGYGIGLSKHGDVWQVVTVNCVEQTVSVAEPEFGPVSFESFAEGGILLLAEAAGGA